MSSIDNGASIIGLRTMIDGGAANFTSTQLYHYCNFHGIGTDTKASLENVIIISHSIHYHLYTHYISYCMNYIHSFFFIS